MGSASRDVLHALGTISMPERRTITPPTMAQVVSRSPKALTVEERGRNQAARQARHTVVFSLPIAAIEVAEYDGLSVAIEDTAVGSVGSPRHSCDLFDGRRSTTRR